MTAFSPGSLVRARGREWVVQPESEAELLVVKPLGGTDDEITGIWLPLETVTSSAFAPPDPSKLGDDRSCRLLRDAVRLSFRSGAGPFRSFGRLSFEPRPYQLVPLLMALRQDPVRLLIADDVGIGKTIEAALIARELLDRGEIQSLAVLCPPHLAEQWQEELREKFHIDAELVLSSTAPRLERALGGSSESLFDRHPIVIVSLDFIKSERRKDEFLRHAPDLVIVDEAHTCAFGAERGGQHRRHQLVQALAAEPERHLILVTATPHSGKPEQFRSLLTFLDPTFASLPDDLSGTENEAERRRLARHLVQRRRADLRAFLAESTPFPERAWKDETYRLSPAYRKLLDAALAWARATVREAGTDRRRERIRWWSVLALLRSLASSPAAAATTLRTRAATLAAETAEDVDLLGRAAVLDLDLEDDAEDQDLVPGADIDDESTPASPAKRQLLELARAAAAIGYDEDTKLKKAVQILKALLDAGSNPIVFCRFVPTAEAVSEVLKKKLGRDVEVEAVTGRLAPADREARVLALAEKPKRVLVATDCLSEGINLQDGFDAVVHYDLAWNPTRHEQREGRVDRYGQPKPEVKVITLYGTDNAIDGFVLNVLIKKHVEIRAQTGVSVPVPGDLRALEEAILNNVLLGRETDDIVELDLFGNDGRTSTLALHAEWVKASEREKRSRTVFAQEAIKVDEVAGELLAAREAIGSGVDLRGFVTAALEAHRAAVTPGTVPAFELSETPLALREVLIAASGGAIDRRKPRFAAAFTLPCPTGALALDRTHPLVEGLAAHVLSSALDSVLDGVARRAGVITTRAVKTRTTVILLRLRFHLITRRSTGECRHLAEEAGLFAFTGAPDSPTLLNPDDAESLLSAKAERNTSPELARSRIEQVLAALPGLRRPLEAQAEARAAALLDAHRRVRRAADHRGVRYEVTPELPVDILGVYVFLPIPV